MHEPVTAELVVALHLAHERSRPATEGVDDVRQPLAPLGERVGLIVRGLQAVGERRLDTLPAMLEDDASFTLGDNTVRGRDAFVNAFRRLLPIIERNDIRHLFVDGDEACVVYDFVTSTPVGPVLSVEHITLRDGRIASSTLVFERLHWPEVMTVLKDREARQA